ncbi:MAG: hypothetical protein JNM76_14760 [Betaproteobacteria bacterium]|nr:hypothetical protein [Betaproteobacteria bacterium]
MSRVDPFPRPPHTTAVTAAGNCRPVVCREVEPPAHDWIRGLLCITVLILFLAVIERNERYTAEQIARTEAEQRAAADRRALELANAAPQVRIDTDHPDGVRCDHFRIREEWRPSILDRCIQLGQAIRAARATE